MRYKDIQFRESQGNYQLVKWFDLRPDQETPTCYVIAFFEKHKEGYDMRTVGDRFFQHEHAYFVAKQAMQFLDALFSEEEDNE